MIYLTEGNTPLNEAYNDEIVQERNNTYQLTFRFPTSDPKWELLKEETFLTADDLHGEQDFYMRLKNSKDISKSMLIRLSAC